MSEEKKDWFENFLVARDRQIKDSEEEEKSIYKDILKQIEYGAEDKKITVKKFLSTTDNLDLLYLISSNNNFMDLDILKLLIKNPNRNMEISSNLCSSIYLPKNLYKHFKAGQYRKIMKCRLYENFIKPDIKSEEREDIDWDGNIKL